MRIMLLALILISPLYSQITNRELLNEEQLLQFQEHQLDPAYLDEFPFSEYRIVRSRRQGFFYIDKGDFIKDILASGMPWENSVIDLIRQYVRPHTIAIDVGAHIGSHILALSKCVKKDGVVIAFEPQAKINRELVFNSKLNKCENVIAVHAALGAKGGSAYLEPVRPDNEGYRCISALQQVEKITLLTLDEFYITGVSFIKIDVESYELEVLKGALDTIMRNRPVIVIEIGGGISKLQEENIDPKQHLFTVIDMLENVCNYEVTVISANSNDYLAIPKN